MAIFGRRRRGNDDDAVAGVAIVTSSSMTDNVEHRGGRNVEVRDNAFNQFNLGTIPHYLTLEVRIPGRAPYEVNQRVNVPAKATGRQGYELPAGLEVPSSSVATTPTMSRSTGRRSSRRTVGRPRCRRRHLR